MIQLKGQIRVNRLSGKINIVPGGFGNMDANIVPLTVTKNGTYDAECETVTVTWDANSSYDFAVMVDGLPMNVKMAAGLTVPDDISQLLHPEYTITIKLPDGTENTIPLSELDMVETMGCYMSNELLFAVVWIKDASAINEAYGTAFRNNTVYFTDFPFNYMDLGGCEITLAAPGKKLDGYFPVVVNVGGAIDLSNIPEVDSIENPTESSPTAVRYDGEIYLLCEGELTDA